MKRTDNFWKQISIEHLWVFVILVGIFVFVNTHPIRPHDFWFHLALGRDLITEGRIPIVDTYSFTRPGQEYLSTYTFWLSELVLYLVYQTSGAIGIVIITSLIITTSYGLLTWISIKSTLNWRAAAVGTMFSWAMGFGNWNVRPQIFAYLWIVILLFAIHQIQESHKRLWFIAFPAVMMFWVNMHGSYPLGLAVIGCWMLDELWRGWRSKQQGYSQFYFSLAALVAASAACILNPRGLGAIQYLNTMASSEILKNFVLEWLPPTFDTLEGAIFLIGLLFSAVFMAVSPRRPSLFQILMFLIFGILGLRYIRGAVWFGILMAQPVTEAIAPIMSRSFQSPTATQATQRINLTLTIFLGILAFVSLPWFKQYWPVLPEKAGLISYDTPVEATQYLIDHRLPGKVFHNMAYGSYLIWAAQPDYKVFVDSRIELYPNEIWMDYLAITNAQNGWEDLLEKYQVSTLILGIKDQSPLVLAVELSDDWKEFYSDQTVIIFSRR